MTIVTSSPSCRSRPRRLRWGWLLLQLGPLGLSILLVAAVWGLTWQQLERESALALAAARNDCATLARVVAANLDQLLGRPLIYGERAAELLDREVPGAAPSSLNPGLSGDRAYLRLAVFDAGGRLRHASSRLVGEGMPAGLGLALPGEPGRLVLGTPAGTGEDAWLLPLGLELQSPRGRSGLLLLYLDLGYFLRLYQGAGLGDKRIGIARLDGRLLVEADDLSMRLGGSEPSGEGGLAPLQAVLELERYPVRVIVSQPVASLAQGLQPLRQRHLAWAGALTLLLGLAGLGLTGLAARQRRLYQRLALSEAEKQDLIELLEEEKGRAYHLASHDPLTGLPNRMLFAELAASHLSGAHRGGHLHAVMFVDLDRFKQVNDSYGHGVGDLLLQCVAQRLRSALRESDLVSRQGGDEFVILANDVGSVDSVAAIAAKLIAQVGAPCELGGHRLQVRPSIGVALAPRDGFELDVLLARADEAMYGAKAAGRGTFRFYDGALNVLAQERDDLASGLEGLLSGAPGEQLVLHYQGQFALDDFRLLSFEVLVRWQHPDYGLVFPRDLLPLVAERGRLPELGLRVLAAACRQLAAWRAEGRILVPLMLNLSGPELDEPGLAGRVGAALAEHGLAPELLVFDIPGNWLVAAGVGQLARLEALSAQGVGLRVQDFGAGQVGFQHLGSLARAWLEIPVACLGSEQARGQGAGFIVTLAHVQGYRVLAAGVETPEQLSCFKASGVDAVRGFLLHRPAPVEELGALLRQGRIYP